MDHLVSSQVKHNEEDDDHTIVNEPTSNTIDMSTIGFGNKRVEARNNSTILIMI